MSAPRTWLLAERGIEQAAGLDASLVGVRDDRLYGRTGQRPPCDAIWER
jgi:hypothetical protein